MEYRKRILDRELAESLEAAGAVVIEGPKACGKTETARRAAKSEIRVDTPAAHQAFTVSQALVLDGNTPRLLDEWQAEPDLWNVVRHAVDDRASVGQFILTGSAVPRDDIRRHPGAGRFLHLRMRPMSLFETGHSAGTMSLARILADDAPAVSDPGLDVKDIAERIVVGGWPGHLGLTPNQSLRAMQGYIDDVCRVDVPRLDGVRRDPTGIRALFNSLARTTGNEAATSVLTADVAGAERDIKVETVRIYLDALERLMITDDVPAWKPDLRSRARLRGSPIRHLVDPSLATGALNAGPGHVLANLNWMGFLFESMVVRDLRVYASPLRAEIRHYRDGTGLEADAIIELPNGEWAGFEIKLGSTPDVVDGAAANLLKIRDRVAGRAPLALGVIIAKGFGFRRTDGVWQIPIGALAP